MATNWLDDLARRSLGDFDTTDDLDREITCLALKARVDDDAAWRLFGLLASKIARFVQRFRSWDLGPFDLDDVAQESYLVFLDTLERWRPRWPNVGPTGFLYYFLSIFPRSLVDAVRSWQRVARVPVIRKVEREPHLHLDDRGALMEEFCRNLHPQEVALLRLWVIKGFSVVRAAETMGLPRRTAYRRWHHILELGREYLREAG